VNSVKPLKALGLVGAMMVAASLAFASWSAAEGFAVDQPKIIVVGEPQGASTRDRVDVARRGQTATALPAVPTELWRRELAGGLEVSPVVDVAGDIVAALASPHVVKLAADGRQVWRTRLGTAPAVAPVAITSDGSTAVVCSDGTLWSVSSGGAVRFSTHLETRTRKVAVAPLTRDDGGIVVAGDSALVMVGPAGEIQARTGLAGRPSGGLLPWRGGVLATLHDGTVQWWQPPKAAREVGQFGGELSHGAVLASARTLVAVVERSRVVALDLLNGSATLLLARAGTGARLEGPPTLASSGVLLVTSIVGELFGIDGHGALVRRSQLEGLPISFSRDAGAPASIFTRVQTRRSPPLIVDDAGRIGFARNSGRIGVVDESGGVATATERLCARPLSVLPAGDARMVAACHSGSVALYSDGGSKHE